VGGYQLNPRIAVTALLVVPARGIVIGMAPKREGTAINVRLPEDVIAKIDHRRASTGQSRAEAIRKMLAWALTQKADHD